MSCSNNNVDLLETYTLPHRANRGSSRYNIDGHLLFLGDLKVKLDQYKQDHPHPACRNLATAVYQCMAAHTRDYHLLHTTYRQRLAVNQVMLDQVSEVLLHIPYNHRVNVQMEL